MNTDTHTVPFQAHMSCAASTGTFRFGKPAGYSFEPGQYFSLTLDTREGEQTKHFSHCDAPGDPYVELTTRLSGSAFKDALLDLRMDDLVRIAGPRGRLTLPDGTMRVGFLVGGVGITPAHSIIRDAVSRATGLDVLTFFGNPDQSCIPFKAEFDEIEATHPGIRFVHVLQLPPEGWDGERGFISAELVRRHCDPLDGRYWISAGPPAMTDAMTRVFAELGVPQERVAMERFAGYA
jgi:ferredoxin-NADP reductase